MSARGKAELAWPERGELRLLNTDLPRVDAPLKVTGRAVFPHDVRLPGMLFGRVVRPPSYEARLQSVDLDAVRALPGVVDVVRDGRFLGVVAEREDEVERARERLAVWALGVLLF